MKLNDWILCAVFSVTLPIGQVLFKWAANTHATQSGPLVLKLATNFPLFFALFWYGMSAMFWFYILTRIPLSAAYPVAILGSGLVPLFAWIFFRERLSPELLVGLGVMLLGLYIIQRGTA